MCGYYLEVQDPALIQQPGLDRLRGMMTRVIYEQASFQYSEMENVGRSVALLIDQAADCEGARARTNGRNFSESLSRNSCASASACTSRHFRMAVRSAAYSLKAPHVVPIFTPLPVDRALEGLILGCNVCGHSDRTPGHRTHRRGIWLGGCKSLQVKPIVAMGEGYIMPIPRYVLDRFTPTGLYFIVLARHGFGSRTLWDACSNGTSAHSLANLVHGRSTPRLSTDRMARRQSTSLW